MPEPHIRMRSAISAAWLLGLLLAVLECIRSWRSLFSTSETMGGALLALGGYPPVTVIFGLVLFLVPALRRRDRFVGWLVFLVITPWLLAMTFPRVINIMFLQPGRWPSVIGVMLLAFFIAREGARRASAIIRLAPTRLWFLLLSIVPICFGIPAVMEGGGRDSRLIPSAGAGSGPNILLITVDTLRRDGFGCYGGPPETTPCADSLAASGRMFSNASSCSPWTLASLASLMTGHYPSTTGVLTARNRLSNHFQTMAEFLGEHGFHTHAIVSNIWLRPVFGMSQGFEIFNHRAPPEPAAQYQAFFGYRVYRLISHLRMVASDAPPESAQDVADQVCSFLESAPPSPFFLWLHFNDVHDPYRPPPGFRPPMEPGYRGPFRMTSGSMMTLRQGGRISEADRRRIRALYSGEIRYVDSQMRRVLSSLREAGLADSTVVIVTSDHGEEFWEHDNVMHGHTVYSELMEIPLVISWPGRIQCGDIDDRLSSLVDLLPTVAGLAGLEPPRDLPGRSLFHDGSKTTVPQYGEGLQFYRELKSISVDGWKLIRSPDSEETMLYHIETDPLEKVEQAVRHPETEASLGEMLDTHLQACRERADRLELTRESTIIHLTPELREKLRAQGYLE